MYNDNKYSCYTRRRIMILNIYSCYTRRRILKYLLSLYKKTYNDNKYSCYTRICIIETNILLYKKTYNKIFVSIIQEDV